MGNDRRGPLTLHPLSARSKPRAARLPGSVSDCECPQGAAIADRGLLGQLLREPGLIV